MKNKKILLVIPFFLISLLGINMFYNYEHPIGLDTWYHKAVIRDIVDSEKIIVEHPFDRNNPNTYPFGYHIFLANISNLLGISIEGGIVFASFTFWYIIILLMYLLSRILFNDKVALLSTFLTTIIPTSFFMGGPLLPFPRLMGDALFLFCIYIFLKLCTNKDNLNYMILVGIGIFSLSNIHTFSVLIFSLVFLLAVLLSKKKLQKKYFFIICLFILISQIVFWIPLLLNYGLPKLNSNSLLAVKAFHPTIDFLESQFGLLIIIFFISFPIIIKKFKCKDYKHQTIFVFSWLILNLLISQLCFIGLCFLPSRFLYESVYPLIILSSLGLINLFGGGILLKYIRLGMGFIILVLFIFQFAEIYEWSLDVKRDIINKSQDEALEWLKQNSLKEDKVLTDEWSCYHIAGISERQCIHVTGFYTDYGEITGEVSKMFLELNNTLLLEYNVSYIYIHNPNTVNWLYSRSNNKTYKEILERLGLWDKKDWATKAFDNREIKIYKLK